MTIQKKLLFLLCSCLCIVILAQPAWAQTNRYKFNVYLSDVAPDTATLTIGIHPAATAHIDGPIGFALGDTVKELEIPVAGPSNFDCRLTSQVPRDSIGAGSLASIHHFTRLTQTERWMITFQPESDSGNASPMKLWWPSGLGSVGGGYWKLVADDQVTILADMVSQTTYTMGNSLATPQIVYIVSGDSANYLTANSDSLALAVDGKGKTKSVKEKAYQSRASFDLTVAEDSANLLHVEFGQGILDFIGINPVPNTITPAPTPDGKTSKYDFAYTGPGGLALNSHVMIDAHGAKGKQLLLGKYWWSKGEAHPVKLTGPAPVSSYQYLPLPNWDNVGEELYTQVAFGVNGINIGELGAVGMDAKAHPIIHNVIHPKWKDVIKTLYGGSQRHAAAPKCLSTFTDGTGKAIVKVQKSLPAKKHDNVLLAEMVALRFNIGMSAGGLKTNTGFGELLYDGLNDPDTGAVQYNGRTVSEIADLADSVISCDTNYTAVDPGKLYRVILNINNAFGGTFDTAHWGNGGKLKLKSARYLAFVNPAHLYRTSNVAPAPKGDPNWVYKGYEPQQFKLEQNYPNPFNPTTTIEFNMPADGFATLKVYNMLGQEVATILDHESVTEGVERVDFNAGKLASGVYFYRLVTETVAEDGGKGVTFSQVKKMMLIK